MMLVKGYLRLFSCAFFRGWFRFVGKPLDVVWDEGLEKKEYQER